MINLYILSISKIGTFCSIITYLIKFFKQLLTPYKLSTIIKQPSDNFSKSIKILQKNFI